MKPIIITTSLALGLLLGFLPAIDRPRPFSWKIFAVTLVTMAILLNITSPIAAEIENAEYLAEKEYSEPIQIIGNIEQEENSSFVAVKDNSSSIKVNLNGKTLPDNYSENDEVVLKVQYDPTIDSFKYLSTEAVNPFLIFPYIPRLEEKVRIMNFHVPIAWVAVLAYLISMVYSIIYLKKRDIKYDINASSAAALGLIFTILATTTGMLWAKFNWGSFWNWDPRQTSILVLLLIYTAYFALRSAINNYESKARLSAVYSTLAFVTVPFLIFIIPRVTSGLHPGSANDNNVGPVLTGQPGMLDSSMLIAFALSLAAFTMLFFWLMNLHIRLKRVNLARLKMETNY